MPISQLLPAVHTTPPSGPRNEACVPRFASPVMKLAEKTRTESEVAPSAAEGWLCCWFQLSSLRNLFRGVQL
jgi:hypothetical protein